MPYRRYGYRKRYAPRRKGFKRNYRRNYRAPYKRRPHRYTATLSSRAGRGVVRTPFPPKLFTVMNYSTNLDVTQSVSAFLSHQTFRANSVYDPYQTGTGNQPRYFDTLLGTTGGVGIYRRYRVHACAVTVNIFPTSTNGTNSNAFVFIIPRRSSVQAADTIPEARNRPYSRYVTTTTLGSYKPYKVKNYIKNKIHLGSKDIADNEDAAGTFNTNPADEVYFDISFGSIDLLGTVSFTMLVNIKYYVELYELVDVGLSS